MSSVGGVGVVDKSAAILRSLVDGPLDLAGLQVAADLPRATAHRLAVALEQHHLVRRDGLGRFCLGFELIRLGHAAAAAMPLAEVARPALEALRDATGESAQLYIVEGDARRCILSLASPHALRWTVAEGALLPLGLGSAGKVLSGLGAVCQSVEERERGVASVSAAVLGGDGSLLAAVSVSGPVERISRAPARRFGGAVRAAAAAITAALPR